MVAACARPNCSLPELIFSFVAIHIIKDFAFGLPVIRPDPTSKA